MIPDELSWVVALHRTAPVSPSKTRSAASNLKSRCFGCLSCTATDVISPSNGSTPAWFATTSAAPKGEWEIDCDGNVVAFGLRNGQWKHTGYENVNE